jgi:hypothetical protein
MVQEVMVENTFNGMGVYAVHVMRLGRAVEWEGWQERLPWLVPETIRVTRWVEEKMGMHHLLILGRVQDVMEVRYPDGTREKAAFWWAKDLGIREAAKQAAERFYICSGRDAARAVVKQAAPQGKLTLTVLGLEREMALESAGWVPQGYVVVMGVLEHEEGS